MNKFIKINYFIIIVSFVTGFFCENTIAQNNLNFKSFAAEFIRGVPLSKEYFLENSEEYIKSLDYGQIILEVPHPASEKYDWVKGYINNSIYTTDGETIICFYIDDYYTDVLNRLKNIPQNKLIFKNDDGNYRFMGYYDENGNFVKQKYGTYNETIVGDYICHLKFIKKTNGSWKLNILDTGGE